MKPNGFKLDDTQFYGGVSPSGKYFVTWIVANYKKEMKKVRNNKMETKCVLTLRQFDCDDGGIKVAVMVNQEKHSISPLNILLKLFMDDWFILLFVDDFVEIRSTETLKIIHNIQVDNLLDYANGYLISRPWSSADSTSVK